MAEEYKMIENRKNPYLQNLCKIEFVVTYACTGRCKHCSEGDHDDCGEAIDAKIAQEAVSKIATVYDIQTVMTFGGEPLLYPDVTCAILNAAKEAGVAKRQVITNGYFTKSPEKRQEVAQRLLACGVNDLLLSVDAFHQETIPLATVKQFAIELKRCGVPFRLSPAWLVTETDDNPYNRKTREILRNFSDLSVPVGAGNVIFPEGNAKKYLSAYFANEVPQNPYLEDRYDLRCLSFSPNGDVLDGNVYRQDVLELMQAYRP